MSELPKLIFVYNANSGKLNAFLDTLHKKLSPSTYQCKLCAITYGSFSEIPEWKKFRENFPGEMEFLHIDEFEAKYPAQASYPIVLSQKPGSELELVLSTEKMNQLEDLGKLIDFFKQWANLD